MRQRLARVWDWLEFRLAIVLVTTVTLWVVWGVVAALTG
jgi:hypothetical protein